MRAIAVVLLGSLVACAGELAPETSGRTASQQQAEPEAEAPAAPAAAAAAATPAAAELPPNTSSYPRPTWGVDGCFLSPGPAAPGECTVGTERECPDSIERRETWSFMGAPICRQKCINVDGASTWSEPTMNGACAYHDTNLHVGTGMECGCNTPLVLSFDDAPVIFNTQATGAFDLTRNGMSHGGDWPTAVTPWLAIDRDGNGTIDDGGELFGSATRLAAGGFAKNGFDALRDLDDNHDGVFDGQDTAFTKIVVWSDRNADRVSTPNEMTSLTDAGVKAIDLHDHRDVRCDARMNCEGERSRFTSTDGRRGTVIDVYLQMR